MSTKLCARFRSSIPSTAAGQRRSQRAVNRIAALMGRPWFIVLVGFGVGAYGSRAISWRAGLALQPIDPPPFAWLEVAASLFSLFLVVLLLVAQKHEDELNAHRDTLTLELSILSEHKIAKVIQLLEELRRDSPHVQDREDPQAEQMAEPADAGSVLAAVRAKRSAAIAHSAKASRGGTNDRIDSFASRQPSMPAGAWRICYGYSLRLRYRGRFRTADDNSHHDGRSLRFSARRRRGDGRSSSSPLIPAERFVDDNGNMVRRLSAPAGRCHCAFRASFEPTDVRMRSTRLRKRVRCPTCRPIRCHSFGRADTARPSFCPISPGRISAPIIGGWARVQAICDFVHQRLRFSYPEARPTRTASDALAEGVGVCRDFTHLAVALCRCLNIPARYCNGYLGDIGVPPDPAPMDFNAWFEAFLGDRWFTFDARHNQPRIGRILIARGRDAADIPMITTFGSHALTRFTVVTEEIEERVSVAA